MRREILAWPAAFAMLILAAGATAETHGTTPRGLHYVMGGAIAGELALLNRERHKYSLRLAMADLGSGAHLSGAVIKILDADQKTVFNGKVAGPWLMIDLPFGRYTVAALLGEETRARTAHIEAGDHRDMIIYFDVPDAASRVRSCERILLAAAEGARGGMCRPEQM
jgi:hypothetical protein